MWGGSCGDEDCNFLLVVSLIYCLWIAVGMGIRHLSFWTGHCSLGISTVQKLVDLEGYIHNATYDLTESIDKSSQSKRLWALAILTVCRACSPLPTGSLFISTAWLLKEIWLICCCGNVCLGTTIQYKAAMPWLVGVSYVFIIITLIVEIASSYYILILAC